MKKNLIFILCCILMFGFYSCGTSGIEKSEDMNKSIIEENLLDVKDSENRKDIIAGGVVQMPNPYFNFDTLEEAEEMAGFSISLPEEKYLPDWIIKTDYRATKSNLIEIIYPGDENYSREIRFRKAMSDREDISGDYNFYEKESVIEINEKKVTVRINNDKIYGAIWHDGDYAYSVRVSDGISEDELSKLIFIVR